MKRFRQGLVVGKFCPLHRGHMVLIEAALDACDELLIISYTKPEFEGCAPPLRERWLAELYPQARRLVIDDARLIAECARRGVEPLMEVPPNDASDAVHREFTAWLCRELAGVVVDAVFTSEAYGDGFAAALAACQSRHLGRDTAVTHVCVDRARMAVPVSGTRVRSDPHAWRGFLDPRVYADFVDRICILGGESTGKTTLVQALAAALDTIRVPEFGRQHWEDRAGRFVFDDMRIIAETQVALETALAQQARRWLVCDGSALTTVFYSQDGYGRVDPAVEVLAQRSYAFTFVCAPDFPFVQDGTRRDAAFRARQHQWYLSTLDAAGIDYVVLSGSVAERVRTALGAIAARSPHL
ncbi:AAA family ATPase [Massilia sp.]|uniref:AAA family ATPase n=1 Tax=Massilia sp. TaxID=1882437 RepID=UPI0028974DAF|nr:AAA family ATPase [Massilia sp.]